MLHGLQLFIINSVKAAVRPQNIVYLMAYREHRMRRQLVDMIHSLLNTTIFVTSSFCFLKYCSRVAYIILPNNLSYCMSRKMFPCCCFI